MISKTENDERSIEQYVSTLIKSGYEAEKADAYSKAQLFNESKFEDSDISNLKSLIDSTVRLIENIEYRELIDRHVSIVTLQGLAVDLMRKYVDEAAKNRKKQYVNDLIDTVRSELRMHTAATPVEDVDLYQKALNRKKVEKFEEVVNAAKSDEEIYRKEIQGYVISATRRRFSGAQELKNVSRKMLSFSEAFASYDSPYAFLKALREIEALEEAEYYKFFVKLEYQVLNKHGYKVSGGERSEFRLLQEINDAQQFDMLLIDEPESSFDNIFLMSQVNQLIKDISKNMPVAIVTHNSTVGASIKPDYVVYTSKTIEDGCVSYELYSGYPSDKYLRGLQGNQVRNHEALMNCLEAGEEAYKDRGASYEILKD